MTKFFTSHSADKKCQQKVEIGTTLFNTRNVREMDLLQESEASHAQAITAALGAEQARYVPAVLQRQEIVNALRFHISHKGISAIRAATR
jgi:hypothetical protein